MKDSIDLLTEMLAEAHTLIEGVSPDQLDDPTPCSDFDVRGLLNHMTSWVTVFDGTVNERPLDFDPEAFSLTSGWADQFAVASRGITTGLREKGVDRPMVMTTDPIPGSVVLDMLLMEYIGHGLDLAMATSQSDGFTEEQAVTARSAAERMISPEYRGHGPGQFHPVVEVGADASEVERYVGFIGRDPAWKPVQV
jgi:uncharacterized protein (TIGR03086 family)